jgi:hypothetical protein
MTVDKTEVRAFLAHASEGYDPAKAHEYYMQNRELKDAKPASSESKGQRKVRVQADKQTRAKKSSESKSLTSEKAAQLKQLRSNAEASRKRIEENLSKHLAKLNLQKMIPLYEIPENASDAVREYLTKQNSKISEKNALEATNNRVASKVRSEARAEMQRVGTELKAAVATARDSYAKAKAGLNGKYPTPADTKPKNDSANVK